MKNKSRTPSRSRVWPLLAHGGWKTPHELGCGFGEAGGALHEMNQLLAACRVLTTNVPGSGRTMYHRTTAETRFLDLDASSMAFQNLPYPLKRSLARKLISLKGEWGPEPDMAAWAMALTALERHIDSIGLGTIRPRPEDHFLFPCGWQATHDPFLNPVFPVRKESTFQVDFVEAIPSKLAYSYDHNMYRYEDEDHHCNIQLGEDALIRLRMMSVADATLELKTLKILSCPSREAIIDETVKRLQIGAADWSVLAPFTPILINPEFQLLTSRERLCPYSYSTSRCTYPAWSSKQALEELRST